MFLFVQFEERKEEKKRMTFKMITLHNFELILVKLFMKSYYSTKLHGQELLNHTDYTAII